MAVSPLVMSTGTPDKKILANNARLTALKSQANGQEKEEISSTSVGGRDLAEQMNEAEKQKYVKGSYFHSHSEIPL